MALPPSQTRVCNSALAHLGESNRIASINDATPLARTLAAVWDEAVDEVLAAHPWNPALRRASIAASADYVPDGGQYSQAFALPSDCVRWLPWRPGHDDYFEGEEENGFILSNDAAPLNVRYIGRLDDLTKWRPGMLACLAAKLARKTARAITGSTTVMREMQTVYDDALTEAKREDGTATGERARFLQVESNWLDARNRTSRGIRYR